ncbi:MAG: polysaccharide biosynthesis/export family protein [bacterium]|nr:polysaccharide biosynthesis/export family protein [bacterium]
MTGLIAGLALALGCTTNPQPPPAAPSIESYIVGAPDELTVHILPDPEINREVRVRPDGMISIDLVGDVQAAGRTPRQIALDIQEQIGRFKRDAVVNVTVVSSPSQFVTVYGEVASPGIFSLETETRVSEAIGRVGGTRPFANLDAIRLVRTRGNETRILAVDLDAISYGDMRTNHVLREGDLIVVPPTILARFGYAMQALLFPFQPLIAAGQSAGAIAAGAQTVQ